MPAVTSTSTPTPANTVTLPFSRLGKGLVAQVAYAPTGKVIGIATTLGIWLYQTDNLKADPLLLPAFSTLADKPVLVDTYGTSSLAFSPDGHLVASGSDAGAVQLLDVSTGKTVATLATSGYLVFSVAFSPDGRLLAAGSLDGLIQIWDIASGKRSVNIPNVNNAVFSVAFSPDSRLLATGMLDRKVRLWDVATGKLLNTLSGHINQVTSVAFSSDGHTLASGSLDLRCACGICPAEKTRWS